MKTRRDFLKNLIAGACATFTLIWNDLCQALIFQYFYIFSMTLSSGARKLLSIVPAPVRVILISQSIILRRRGIKEQIYFNHQATFSIFLA